MKIEHISEMRARHWWVMTVANAILDAAPSYMKGENLLYFNVALHLVASDPDGFERNGYDIRHVRFYDHHRKGKKLVAVKARWEA